MGRGGVLPTRTWEWSAPLGYGPEEEAFDFCARAQVRRLGADGYLKTFSVCRQREPDEPLLQQSRLLSKK